MKRIKAILLSNQSKLILRCISYTIFLIYGVYTVLNNDDIIRNIIIIIITLLFLSVAIYYEYLKVLYQKAIYHLNFNLNLDEAIKIFNKLQNKDFLNGFAKERVVFDCLINLSKFKTDDVLNTIKDNPKIFNANINQLLLGNGMIFLAYAYGNQKNKIKKTYGDVVKFKDLKIKGQKISQIYNYYLIDAIYYLSSNDIKKAKNSFELVNTMYMNNREISEFYYFYGLLAIKTKDKELFQNIYNNLCDINANSEFVKRLKDESRL